MEAKRYNISYYDVNGLDWQVLIEDTLKPPNPYSVFYNVRTVYNPPNPTATIVESFSFFVPAEITKVEFVRNGTVVDTFFPPFQAGYGNTAPNVINIIATFRFYKGATYEEYVAYNNVLEVEYIPLKPATESPVRIKTLNNDGNKFQTIRAKECVIKFINDDGISLIDFVGTESPDDRWKVTVLAAGATVFIGFLAMDDLKEPLLDATNVVTLTATDGLGKIKDVPLSNDVKKTAYGVNSLITYLAWALAGTGLALRIICCDRSKVETGSNEFYTITVVSSNTIRLPGYHSDKINTNETMRLYMPTGLYDMSITSYNYDGVNTEIVFAQSFLTAGTFENTRVDFPLRLHPALETAQLDAERFKSSDEPISCASVIEYILKDAYYVTQENGYWYIVNVAEAALPEYEVREYTSLGVANGSRTESNVVEIGDVGSMQFIDRSAVVQLVRPLKYARSSFNYINNDNFIGNTDFSEGAYQSDEVPPIYGYKYILYEDGKTRTINSYGLKKYNPTDWTLSEINTATGALSEPDITAYIRRYFLENKETAREMVISSPTANTKNYVLENNGGIPVEKGDKILFNVKWRAPNFIHGGNTVRPAVAQVILIGNSGAIYTLQPNNSNERNKWYVEPNANVYTKYLVGFQTNYYPSGNGGNAQDARYGVSEWCNIKNDYSFGGDGGGAASEGFPEDGVLKIRLCHFTTQFNDRGLNEEGAQGLFTDLKIEVVKFQQGNELQAAGQYNKISRPGNYAAVKDDELFIDNVNKRSYPGALLIKQGVSNAAFNYSLAGNFLNDDVLPGIVGSWGKMVAYLVWRQLGLIQRTISGSMITSIIPNITRRYNIEPTSDNEHVNGRSFALLSYDWDCQRGRINNANFMEILPPGAIDGEFFESGFIQN